MKLSFGPGALVAAAFVGPGTVTACTLAGVRFGYELIWALVFATFATIILQSMAARLGIITRKGLGETLMMGVDNRWARWTLAGIILAALGIGNAAYEAGNLTGGVLGLMTISGDEGPGRTRWLIVLTGLAGGVLLYGRYRVLERILIGLVLIMALAFLGSFLLIRPNPVALLGGLVPRIPPAGLFTTIALIGTTIVPYNLFLHAAAARERWAGPEDLAAARGDAALSIGLGGLMSILILATAAATLFGENKDIQSASDMASALDPVAGPWARYLIGFGLFAAGLTSSITAPMATGYVLSEMFPGQSTGPRGAVFRAAALAVLAIGFIISLINIRPINVIVFAQMANGVLLPVIALFLLITMTRRSVLGNHVSGRGEQVAGAGVVLVTFALGLRLILRSLGVWP